MSIRTVMLNRCTSDDCPAVLKLLAGVDCVTGVKLSNCSFEEKDLKPLLPKDHQDIGIENATQITVAAKD